MDLCLLDLRGHSRPCASMHVNASMLLGIAEDLPLRTPIIAKE